MPPGPPSLSCLLRHGVYHQHRIPRRRWMRKPMAGEVCRWCRWTETAVVAIIPATSRATKSKRKPSSTALAAAICLVFSSAFYQSHPALCYPLIRPPLAALPFCITQYQAWSSIGVFLCCFCGCNVNNGRMLCLGLLTRGRLRRALVST